MNLAGALAATKGFAALQRQEQYALARKLAERLGDQERLFKVMYISWTYSLVRAEHDLGLATARELIILAENQNSALAKSIANGCLGSTAHCRGDFIIAREHLGRSLALADQKQTAGTVALIGHDSAITALFHLARTLAVL
jgi:hypothetical protein